MGTPTNKLLICIIAMLFLLFGALFLHWRYERDYQRFQAKDMKFYKSVALEMDSFLKNYPEGLWTNFDKTSPQDISVTNPVRADFRILLDYNPSGLAINSNRVGVRFSGLAKLEWDIIWMRHVNGGLLVVVKPYKSERPIGIEW